MALKSLAGKTLFVTGASRGIGKAIALRAARDGANVVIAAKTAEPHPKLPGTIYTAAEEIEKAGGKCLPCIVDIRYDDQVYNAVDKAVAKFGGIDILINNASAIQLTGTAATDMKRFDLMMGINGRGTYLCSKACLPHLKKSSNPHILNISPPLNMKARWFKDHAAYTMAKYGMSMCVLGMSEEFKADGIAVNALWPRTAILTAAMEMLGGDNIGANCRKPEIMSDAAYEVLKQNSKQYTGQFLIDDEVLKKAGVTDMDQYACIKGGNLMPDFFLDDFLDSAEAVAKQAAASGAPSKAPEAAKSTASSGSITKVFDTIKTQIAPELISTMKASYQFELKGVDAGSWYLDLKTAPGGVTQGGPPAGAKAADCTMKLSADDFLSLFAGKLKATDAFFGGKLKISGNMGAAMKLEKLMKQVAQSKAKL